ncbi:MAG: outer membrane beta-barrel protein [Armatimonadota bacterium]
MKRFAKYCVLLMVVALCLSVMPAYAQNVEVGKGLSLAFGMYRPSDSDIKDGLGSNWFSANLSYKLSETDKTESYVGLGYIKAEGKSWTDTYEVGEAIVTDKTDTDGHIIPLTYTIKTKPQGMSKFYYGGGGGIFFSKLEANSSVFGKGDVSDTLFGVNLLAGVKFSQKLSLELQYTRMLNDVKVDEEDYNLSGLSLSLSGSF